jgi:hypothetical protein
MFISIEWLKQWTQLALALRSTLCPIIAARLP